MSVWSKLVTALRGGVNEAIADVQALRILDQEIRDADEELKSSKDSLAELMARKKVAEQKCTTVSNKIAEFEGYAIQALEKSDDSLALELAKKIANLQKQLNLEQSTYNHFTSNVDKLRDAIKQADHNIQHLKQQVDTIGVTANVQSVQEAVIQRQNDSNSKLSVAMESLKRIKEKQELKSALFNAEQELAEYLSEDTLNTRLETAGIIMGDDNGEAVLARLKKRQL